MASKNKRVTSAQFLALAMGFLGVANSGHAQAGPAEPRLVTASVAALAALEFGPADTSSSADQQAQASTTPAAAQITPDDQWHVAVTPYLWFPGMHGTVGIQGRDASVHASAGDVLSHFRFGLAGTTELQRKRLVVPIDFMWVRLQADKSLPFPDVGAESANVKIAELLMTPEVGFRAIDKGKLKIDALTGFRYWHVGQSMSFSPGDLGLNASGSLNWVDPLVGGRIQLALSPKIVLNILGDVGGWGAGSQLQYQAVGLIGYRLKPRWTLLAGYRYLDVDYRNNGNVFDVAMPGTAWGVTYTFK